MRIDNRTCKLGARATKLNKKNNETNRTIYSNEP